MKTIRNLITLSAFLFINIFALTATTEVATIADLKSFPTDSQVVFTG